MKNLYTVGWREESFQQINEAISLLQSHLVWSKDFEQIKPVLLQVLFQYNETSMMLAQLLVED